MGERLNEGFRRPLGRFRGLAACLAGAPEERTVREPVLGMWLRVVEEDVSGGFLRRRRLERRLVDLGGVVLGHELLEEQRNGPGRLVVRRTKDVPVGLHAVDGGDDALLQSAVKESGTPCMRSTERRAARAVWRAR